MSKLVESFEWVDSKDLPKDRLLKVVAKTTKPTIHPEDPIYPVRIFAETELMRNAASLVGRPVGVNHEKMPIYGAYAVDSEWNEEEKQLEALLFVPPKYIEKVKAGEIKNVSVEYTWRNEKKTDEGTEFQGLGITRIDLVEGFKPGDSDAIVSLFETTERRGIILAEVTSLGEPFADYADFADCVAKNQDKDDPEAYCGSIKAKTEGKLTETQEIEKLKKEIAEKTNRVTELETAFTQISQANEALKTSHDKDVKDAKTEGKKEVIEKVSKTIPSNLIVRQSSAGMIRLIQDVRKTLREVETDGASSKS